MAKNNLKPCPFCGSPAKQYVQKAMGNACSASVNCTNSECCAAIEFVYVAPDWVKNPERQTKAMATQRWNRRNNSE